MVDWSDGLGEKLIAVQNLARYTEVFIPYKLTALGWRKLNWDEAHKVKIKDLCLGPYLLKIGEIGYLCGNDDAWSKQEGKPREWIFNLINAMFADCTDHGLTWPEILEFTFHHGIIVYWTYKILGGEFVKKGDSWHSNQNQTSTPF